MSEAGLEPPPPLPSVLTGDRRGDEGERQAASRRDCRGSTVQGGVAPRGLKSTFRKCFMDALGALFASAAASRNRSAAPAMQLPSRPAALAPVVPAIPGSQPGEGSRTLARARVPDRQIAALAALDARVRGHHNENYNAISALPRGLKDRHQAPD